MINATKYKAVPFAVKGWATMLTTNPIVSEVDVQRLKRYLEGSSTPVTRRLQQVLSVAEVVPPGEVPPDVVTMNSQVSIRDPRDGGIESYILSYPDHDTEDDFGVSVFSPLGSALFAARVGREVAFPGARGTRRVFVERLDYQPELAGDFEL